MIFKKIAAIIFIFLAVRSSCAAQNTKAAIAYNNAEFSKAIKEYKRLTDCGDIKGYLNLAVIFKDLGHYGKSISILNKARLKFGNDLRILSILGRIYYLDNQTDEAISVLKKILEIKPGDLDAHITLGLCYEDKGLDAQAQKYYEKAVSLNKDNVIARLLLGGLCYRKDKLPEAIDEYKAVSLIDASMIKIQKLLGEMFLKTGNLKEALRIYQKINLIEPGNKLTQQRISEISGKIGKEYFEKERQRLALRRIRAAILVKPFPKIMNMVFVRVGLIRGEVSVEFKCSTPFEIETKAGRRQIVKGREAENYLITKKEGGGIIISRQNKENIIVEEPVVIRPLSETGTVTIFNVKSGKDNFWSAQYDRSYRGLIEISADKGGISVINAVNLEEYLYSVVPSEMPANWPAQALKAQAIAARSEAMAKLGRHKNEGFDFCPEVHCQSYAGVESETELTRQAVDETRGIVMLYKGKPIDAVYSSNCGGHTQGNIFGSQEYIPYLKPGIDALQDLGLSFPLSPLELEYWLKEPGEGILCDSTLQDSKNSDFRWARIYSDTEINEMLKRIADFGRVNKIIVLKRQGSGHISAVKIIGSNAAHILKKEYNIRKAFGNLRSSMFKIEIKYAPDNSPKTFIFFGGGFGHGVGMCQTGSYGMAKCNKNYKEILSHYFQQVEFRKLY